MYEKALRFIFTGLIIFYTWNLCPLGVSAGETTTCSDYLSSIRPYSKQVDTLLQGGPQTLMVTIQRMIMAQKSVQKERLRTLSAHFREQISALNALNPPPSMLAYHRKLVEFYRVATVFADDLHQAGPSQPVTGLRPSYEALLDFYVEMKSVLVKYDCQQKDIDAIDRLMILKVQELLAEE